MAASYIGCARYIARLYCDIYNKKVTITFSAATFSATSAAYLFPHCNILEIVINEDPENIFIINLLDSTKENIFYHSFEQLVNIGIANVFISISMDENALHISMNKTLSQSQELYRRIKAIQFD